MNDQHTVPAPHGTLLSYLAGFVLSVALTAVAFVLVMTSALPSTAALVAVTVLAVSQIAVHLVFFLHLGRSEEQRWRVVLFVYTLIILAILVGASIWIMHHLDLYHMLTG